MGDFKINSAEDMIRAVRHYGIIPFFRGPIPGWSIEEMTPREHWFTSSDDLGPWDWKIEVVREGDIAYGKFMGDKAAFATVEFYAHLMNWRRSLPKYRVALGEKHPAKTRSAKIMRALAPAALEAIKANGSANSTDIRKAVPAAVTPYLIRSLGSSYKANLTPSVKKSICDTIVCFLEMGTWSVVGDITRVYRGPNAEYSGWQRSSHTTPDALFGLGDSGTASTAEVRSSSACAASTSSSAAKSVSGSSETPFWARFIDDAPTKRDPLAVDCTPEESRALIIRHILSFLPDDPAILKALDKMV